MKVVVNIPLRVTREYLNDFDEQTIPNVGDDFDEKYYVKDKNVNKNICILDLGFKKFQ